MLMQTHVQLKRKFLRLRKSLIGMFILLRLMTTSRKNYKKMVNGYLLMLGKIRLTYLF